MEFTVDLNKARILGLTGSILGSFGFTAMLIYFITWPMLVELGLGLQPVYIVGLVGFILILRSLGILSRLYRERGIFRYALISVIILTLRGLLRDHDVFYLCLKISSFRIR